MINNELIDALEHCISDVGPIFFGMKDSEHKLAQVVQRVGALKEKLKAQAVEFDPTQIAIYENIEPK